MSRRTRILILTAAAVAAAVGAAAWQASGPASRPAESTAHLIARLDGPTSRPALLELERRAIRGTAPREEMAAILRALAVPRVSARPVIRAGDEWPFQWNCRRPGSTAWNEESGVRPTTAPAWGVEQRLVSLKIDGVETPFRRQHFHGFGSPLPGVYLGERIVAPPSAVGRKVARATIEFRYYGDETMAPLDLRADPTLHRPPPSSEPRRPFSIAWQETIDVPVTILPAGTEDDVERVVDPSLRAAMAAAIVFQSTRTASVRNRRRSGCACGTTARSRSTSDSPRRRWKSLPI